MSLVTLAGDAVLSGTVTRPLAGAWLARLEVDTVAEPLGPMTLSLGGTLLVGTISQASVYAKRVQCVLVGGAGGLATVLPATFYRGVTLRTALSATLTAAGETLSTTSDAAVTGHALNAWARPQGTTAQCLDSLVAKVPGSTWRVLADGTVWVGRIAWPTKTLTFEALSETLAENGLDLRAELGTADFSLDAGSSLLGRKVKRVLHTITPETIRTEVTYVPT